MRHANGQKRYPKATFSTGDLVPPQIVTAIVFFAYSGSIDSTLQDKP
jgi:hypothetical protein